MSLKLNTTNNDNLTTNENPTEVTDVVQKTEVVPITETVLITETDAPQKKKGKFISCRLREIHLACFHCVLPSAGRR